MNHLHHDFLLPLSIVLGLHKHVKGILKVILGGKLMSRITFSIVIGLPTELFSGNIKVHYSTNSADEIFMRNIDRNVDVLGRLIIHRDVNDNMLYQSCQWYQICDTPVS